MENSKLDKQVVWKYIKQTRKEMDLTQEGVAEETGISAKHLGKIEQGKRLTGAQTLNLLHKHLNISIDKLFANVAIERENKTITNTSPSSHSFSSYPYEKHLSMDVLIYKQKGKGGCAFHSSLSFSFICTVGV